MPQARHAPAIAKIPAPPPFGPPPRQDNKSAPPRIAAAPTNSRLSTFSRKTSQAIASVARPSRLSSSETVEAGVVARPAISRTGAIAPPHRMTRANQGRSARASGARSEGNTSDLKQLMRISYAVFCLKKKKYKKQNYTQID